MDLARVAAHEPVAVTGDHRRAAVVVPVLGAPGSRDDSAGGDDTASDPRILFTRRAEDLADHPGQMSFPGGGAEPGDEDLLATALREAEEEVGLDPSEADIVGRIDDLRTVSAYAVRPYVARVPDRTYAPGDREVAEVVPLSLAALTDPANYRSERRTHPDYGEVDLHFFDVEGYTVWGATAQMFVQFLTLATGWAPPASADDGAST